MEARTPERYLKELYRNGDDLFRLIAEFNLQAVRYAHPSWMSVLFASGLDETSIDLLRQSPRGSARLSEILLSSVGLTGRFHFDFTERPARLALLDGPLLERLLSTCGAALNWRAVARVVDRPRREAIKAALGESTYSFAVRRASLLVGESRERSPLPLDRPQELEAFFLQGGFRCLNACLSNEPETVVNRLLLKLPRELFGAWTAGDTSPEERRRAWLVLRKVLLMELDSSWTPYLS